MNYQMLKSIIDSLVQNFKCPDCSSVAWEKDIEIVWAAWKTVNIDITCPNCAKHTMVKAEVSSVQVPNLDWIDFWNLEKMREELTKRLSNLKLPTKTKIEKKETIDDSQIIDLRNKLKEENVSASDFLK